MSHKIRLADGRVEKVRRCDYCRKMIKAAALEDHVLTRHPETALARLYRSLLP